MKNQIMEKIPEGYKQTEIGVIPEDWDVDKLSNVAPLQRGFDLPTSQIKKGPFPVVYSNGILNFHHKAMAKAPGVVTGRSGTIGKVNYIEKDYWPHNTTLWVTNFKGNDEKYIYFLYSHIQIERFRTGSGVPTLNRNDVHDFQVSIPKSKSEQTAIATVLSDADALIEKLEKLIAKKKAIKQGTMQQLLTGKKRLPGFSGEWKYISLEAIAQRKNYSIVDGPFGSQMKVGEFVGAGVPVVEMEHLEDKQSLGIVSRFITNQKFEIIKRSAIYPGDIIISKTGTLGLLGIVPASISKGIITSRLAKISIDRLRADIGFVFHWLRKLKIDGYWEKVSQGGTMQILGIRMLKETPFPHISVLEQTTIATVLSDMDAEIESLKRKRDKYTMLKQGMMQQLLTGRIRIYANN